MVSSMGGSPQMWIRFCVPPMVCGLQLLVAIRFSSFDLGRGVRERWCVAQENLPCGGTSSRALPHRRCSKA
jgi:hypothetical protein